MGNSSGDSDSSSGDEDNGSGEKHGYSSIQHHKEENPFLGLLKAFGAEKMPEDPGGNSQLNTKFDEKVTHFIRNLPQKCFVYMVMNFDPIDSKTYDQLRFHGENENGYTPLHKAVELDVWAASKGSELIYMNFFCDLIIKGVKEKSLSTEDAATIISERNKDNANCLHLALMHDLGCISSLIALADIRTFQQQRSNGNTPLHDAVDFPLTEASGHKFLVPVPKCETVALCTPFHEYGNKQHEKRDITCDLCRRADRKYRNLKKRRSSIICDLVGKFHEALEIRNTMGISPFICHVTGRERFREMKPDLFIPIEKKPKGTRHRPLVVDRFEMDQVLTEATEQRQRANVGANRAPDWKGIQTQPRVETSVDDEPDVKRPNETAATTASDCPPDTRLNYYFLGEEVERVLLDTAFCIGGYEKALKCLFRRVDSNDEGSLEDTPSKFAHRNRSFTPPRRITLTTPDSYTHFTFEPMLAYVHLKVTPNHDENDPTTPEEVKSWREKCEDALKSIFEWLSKTKGVNRILKLVIEDNETFPCSEETLRECLKTIPDIKYLDLKRPNVSVRTLIKAKDVVEIWLYSTGISAVLAGWGDQNGLQRLEKLRMIHLSAKAGSEPADANRRNVEFFIRQLKTWYQSRDVPEIIPYYEEASHHGPQDGESGRDSIPRDLNPWFTKLRETSGRLHPNHSGYGGVGDGHKPASTEHQKMSNILEKRVEIKVALLDDGVDPTFDGLGRFMSGYGWPIPSDSMLGSDRQAPFYSSGSSNHGNYMAKLITTVCPFVKLYVAKIDTNAADGEAKHPTFNPIQAIEVDVISMSWNIELHDNSTLGREFREVIRKASQQNIMMYCAASEKKSGTGQEKVSFPSGCHETCNIGAANMHRQKKVYVDDNVKFLFPSDNVIDGGPSDGGSSAATALASGLASLILFCLRVERQNEEENSEEAQEGKEKNADRMRPENSPPSIIYPWIMEKVFGSLSPEAGSKYADSTKLQGNEAKISVKTITRHCSPFLSSSENGGASSN
ncbi:hypothetical protein NPX13_g7064 [Xylaria arbuscula]|uniref:Peptidase S8/S53 domain-containing protein n=1 Tax=Xylaria arbuscula TaxID=114810 RepID=A0A9W8TL53_9PEZI|nr:hypothetical protein NPX13_g7064 [Xylaria arbuscula]